MRIGSSGFSPLESPWAGLCVVFLLAGCTASAPTAISPEQASSVVGVWEYDVTGSPHLANGTLKIGFQDGRLTGTVRDRQRGHLSARIRLQGRRFEMRVDEVYVSGRVEDNRLQAFCRRPLWDVSTSQNVGRTGQPRRPSYSARLVARRVTAFPSAPASASRCDPLLEEVNYRCRTPLMP